MSQLVMICLLVLGTNAGCSDTSIDLSNYNRSCDFDGDCVSIVSGDVCECGPHCGAINVNEFDLYEDDLQTLDGCGFSVAAACGDRDSFVLCRARSAFCMDGLCAAE